MASVIEWTCKGCQEVIKHTEVDSQKRKNKQSGHRKICFEIPKSVFGWPVSYSNGRYYCPFRYRGCLFSSTKIDPLFAHCGSKGKHCGPGPNETVEQIYCQGQFLPRAELWQYVETKFDPTNLEKHSMSVKAAGISSLTEPEAPMVQPASNVNEMGIRCPVGETQLQDQPPRGYAPVTILSNVHDHMDVNSPTPPSPAGPPPSLVVLLPTICHNEHIIPPPPIATLLPDQQHLPLRQTLAYSVEPLALPASSTDPLCKLTDIEEFDGLSLMTRYQSTLKVFVCERCQCAVWGDHLVGHIFDHHRPCLPPTLKKSTVLLAVQKARGKLNLVDSPAIRVALPQRPLPPLPWLREPSIGYKCRVCPYVAGSIATISTHGSKSHEPGQAYISKHDPTVWVQLLFSKTQYFMVHPMLQNVSVGDLFSKFYSTLPTQYMDGAFVDGETTDAADLGDLSPFLTNCGWVQATNGCSMARIRAMSSVKAQSEQEADWLASIKGLGQKYFSTIGSTGDIDPNLLELLTSWRTRTHPFQLLQEDTSVKNYGLHCDRLIIMTLRILQDESRDAADREEEEDKDDASGYCDGSDLHTPVHRSFHDLHSTQDWQDMDFADEEDDEGDGLWPEHDPAGIDHDGHQDFVDLEATDDLAPYPIVLNQDQRRCAQALRKCCIELHSSPVELLAAYHALLLSIFTTNSDTHSLGPLHSLTDGFIISTSVDIQGCFSPPHLISPRLARMIYAALFSMLTEVLKALDPYQAFIDSMLHWIEPGKRTPFCSIRRYSRLCYTICRGHISLPRLQFTTPYGPEFTFDGKALSVTSLTKMYHTIYREMVRILHQDLLFGASDTVLGPLKKPEEMVEKPHQQVVGRGILVSEMHAAWNPVKFIMSNDQLCKKYFSIDSSGNPVLKHGAWELYLRQVEKFKEHLYFLFHQIPGMPKRGSEEIRAKIVDTSFRGRNIMYLFNRLAIIGDYNKTSRNTGSDKLTLHFLARPLEMVLRRYQASVASISAWAIDRLLPPEKVDPHHHCYLLSSMGNRWSSERLTRILQQLTAEHLPGCISLNMSSLRHILPGIAEHYRISDVLAPRTDDVLHAQLGHNPETGDRMYARSHQSHPRLTSTMAHRTMWFCDLWQELLGFNGNLPDEEGALALQSLYYSQGQLSSQKSLSAFWTDKPLGSASVANANLPVTQNHQGLHDRIIGMERTLSDLIQMVSSITQKLAVESPAIASCSPHTIHQSQHPSGSDASDPNSVVFNASSHIGQPTIAIEDLQNAGPSSCTTTLVAQHVERRSVRRIGVTVPGSLTRCRRTLDDCEDQTDLEVRPPKRPRTAASIDHLDGSEGPGEVATNPISEDGHKQVHCPRCNINIDGSDESIAVHFFEAKKQDADNQWHALSLGHKLRPSHKREIRVYREGDLKFVCPCGKFSHYEKEDIKLHLTSLDATDAHILSQHSTERPKPVWQRLFSKLK